VLKNFKRHIKKVFRELLVYHHSSLEYRAKLLTLMVSANGKVCKCEKQKLETIVKNIYGENHERAELLLDTVYEYHTKIITNNGLDFEHLIQLVEKETKEVRRFTDKIDIASLRELVLCTKDEEERLFQERILEFLQNLKDEYAIKSIKKDIK